MRRRLVHFLFDNTHATACGMDLGAVDDASGFGLALDLQTVSCAECLRWLAL